MTKENTNANSATAKVAKVSSQIKAATAAVEKNSTEIKVNTKKSDNSAKTTAKNNSSVKVNVQKTPGKGNSAPKNKTNNGPKAQSARSSKTAKSTSNKEKRILNVVEFGDDGRTNQANAKATPKNNVALAKSPRSNLEPDAQIPGATKPNARAKESAKKHAKKKKTLAIVLSLTLIIGIVVCAVLWALNRNNRDMCTVTFESNGGSEVADVEVVCGSKVRQPENPTKEGFDFREWSYRGQKYNFNVSTVNEDIILVAKWDAADDTETVTISFDSAGGSSVEDLVIKAGTATMAPKDPTRDGYTFDGWYLGDEKFDFSNSIDEDIVLVAHWTNGSASGNFDSGNSNTTTSRPSSSSNNSSSSNSDAGSTQTPDNGSNSGNSGNTGNTGGDNAGSGDGDTGGDGNTGPGDGTTTPGGDDNTNVPNPDNTGGDSNPDQTNP